MIFSLMFAQTVAVDLKKDLQGQLIFWKKNSAGLTAYVNPVDQEKFKSLLDKYKDIEPDKR